LNFASQSGPLGLFDSAFISVVPFIGAVAGAFCGIVVLVQFGIVVIPGVCDVVVPVPFGFVLVTGVPGVFTPVLLVPLDVVVVVPLLTVDDVDVPFVVVVAFGVGFVIVFVPVVVVADVPGGQFCNELLVVVFVGGVAVVVVVVGVVVLWFVVVVVCANAGTAILTTSPAAEARPRIARELMRLDSPRKLLIEGLTPVTQSSLEL
jgi:hypothetical protein